MHAKPHTSLALATVLAFCTGITSLRAEDIPAIVRDYDAYAREADPIRAAQRGDTAAMRRWPDNSPAAVSARAMMLRRFAERLEAVEKPLRTQDEALDLALLRDRIHVTLAGLAFDEERIPFTSGDGFHTVPDYTALNTILRSHADADAWLDRLDALPAYYARETVNMRRGVASGFTQPDITVKRVISDLRTQLQRDPASSPLLKPLSTLPAGFSDKEQADLRARALTTLEAAINPALGRLLEFFETEYLPHARRNLAVSSLPRGRAYYSYLVRRHTTTTMSPEQIHTLGEQEVRRVRARMEQVMAETGFQGDLGEFLAMLRKDPRFYVPPATYGEKASEVAKRADAALPRFFGLLPRLTYGVQAMPAGLESSANGYLSGSPEQGIAGMVVYKPWLAKEQPTFGIAAWVLHEGVPGHHLQIALAQELGDIPEFRRNDDITAFVEGWALYAERLGEEMGIYRDAYERFGRLSLEMWRACRLVIDTGLHWQGWSRERAASCLLDNSALPRAEIEFEIDRYIAWPAQALAYKVGERKIVELRERAQQALGAEFDLRRFHDLVLDAGPMPLPVLESRVEAWITAEGLSARNRR